MAESIANPSVVARRSWPPLAFLVACHSAFNLFANPIGIASSGPLNWVGTMFFGAMLAQPVLLAEWTVLGPGAAIRRVPLTIAASAGIACAGYYTGWSFLKGSRASNWNEIDYLYIWAITFPVAASLLILAQRLTCWKVIRSSDASGSWAPTNQFSLKYLLGLTALCAILLGTARALGCHPWPGISPGWKTGTIGMLLGLGLALLAVFPAFTIPFLTLTPRPTVQMMIGAPLAWVALTWLVVETVIAVEPMEVRLNVARDVVFLQVGAAVAGFLSAWIVRVAGYRLMLRNSLSPVLSVVEL